MSLAVKLRNIFITGLLALLPIVVTIYTLYILFNLVDGLLRPVIRGFFGVYYPGTGLVAMVIIIFLLGLLVRVALGRKLIQAFENAIEKIPLVRTVYSVVKYASETMLNTKGDFKGVVLLEYPRKGLYTIGFTTGTVVKEIQEVTEDRVINVFVPTAPNPTSGYVVHIPEKDVIPLKMSVEEGLKLIISGGFLNQ